MYKCKKGITLVALVITIIVLLILAGVSINVVLGDNGIFKQAQEAKLLTALSNVMFNLESNIVDINIENMNKTLTTTEVMKELENRNILKIVNKTNLADGILNTNELENVRISYCGNIYIDNYKRGKVQLSKIQNELLLKDNIKIIVNDGSVKRFSEDNMYAYKISSLENRSDFAYWVSQYNEVISIIPTTYMYNFFTEKEITAIYDEETKNSLYDGKNIINVTSDTKMLDDKDTMVMEISINTMLGTVYVYDKNEYKGMLGGASIKEFGVQYATTAEDLLNYEKCIYTPRVSKEQMYKWVNKNGKQDTSKYYVEKITNENGEEKNVIAIQEEDLPNNNWFYFVDISDNISIIKNDFYKFYGIKDVDRIYYRVLVNYNDCYQEFIGNTINFVNSAEYKTLAESVIKYIDV